MKKGIRIIIFVLALCLALPALAELPSIGGGNSGGVNLEGSGQFTAEKGDVTLMIYMIGSNLESDYGCASADIMEIAQSGADFGSLNVVVAAGGATKWQELSVGAGEVGIGTIKRSTGETGIIWDQRVKGSISSVSMLNYFLNYAYTTYPAKGYALVFWNHGGGPIVGFGHDEVSDNLFSLKQLSSALKNSPFAQEPLIWLGFDACLMGSFEVLSAMVPFTDCIIFSEETEPGRGWDYSFVGEAQFSWSGRLAAERICDHYAEMMEKTGDPYTISVALCGTPNVPESLLDTIFSVDITADLKTKLAKAVYATRSFGLVSSNSTYDLYDLADFTDKICDYWNISEESARQLKYAANLVISYNRSNIPGAHGLSFYFPLYTDPAKVGAIDVYDSLSLCNNYRNFLKTTHGIATGTPINGGVVRTYDGKSRLSGLGQMAVKAEKVYSYQMTEEEKNRFVFADYVILSQAEDGKYNLVRRGSGVNADETDLLSISLSDQIDCFPETDAHKQNILTLLEREQTEDETVYFLPAVLSTKDKQTTGSLQVFDRNGQKEIGEFVPYSAKDIPPKQLLSLNQGDKLIFNSQLYLPVFAEDGTLLPFTEWKAGEPETDLVISIDNPDDIKIGSVSADSGTYFIQLIGADVDGHWFCSPLMPFGTQPENIEEEEE